MCEHFKFYIVCEVSSVLSVLKVGGTVITIYIYETAPTWLWLHIILAAFTKPYSQNNVGEY
jgi:hypothetical protein